jgi:hypothetical protein
MRANRLTFLFLVGSFTDTTGAEVYLRCELASYKELHRRVTMHFQNFKGAYADHK